MKKIDLKVLVITCIVCLLPIILGLVFYNELPEQVAIHFDVNNNPDNYFPKILFIFAIPVFMSVIQAVCCIMNDLQDKNPEANKKATSVFKWIIPIITIVLYIVTLMYALGNTIDIRKAVMIILGILFIVTGNYVPKTVGDMHIHFPKFKINDPKLEIEMKKWTGYLLIINGMFCIISILFEPLVSVAFVVLFILEAIVLSVYTWLKSKK